MVDLKIVIGLGNPGKRYEQTRHNLGFTVVGAVLKSCGASFRKENPLFEAARISEENSEFVLARPALFMNESGRAVQALLSRCRAAPEQCLVVVDDVHLPVGKIRFRFRGSSGGHNGLESLIAVLRTGEFPRLRVGVGPYLGPSELLSEFVLAKFPKEDLEKIEPAVDRAKEACLEWLRGSGAKVMQRFN